MTSRRDLLRLTLSGTCLGPTLGMAAGPPLAPCGYTGPGLYLYPSWGRPQPYLITEAGSAHSLEFRDPASGALLWVQSQGLTGDFAGKLVL